jgi:hypothetical protein
MQGCAKVYTGRETANGRHAACILQGLLNNRGIKSKNSTYFLFGLLFHAGHRAFSPKIGHKIAVDTAALFGCDGDVEQPDLVPGPGNLNAPHRFLS